MYKHEVQQLIFYFPFSIFCLFSFQFYLELWVSMIHGHTVTTTVTQSHGHNRIFHNNNII